MAEKIEEFVDKLQQEGVEAGKQQAEEIKKDAKEQASQTIEQARQEAEKIKKDARNEADKTLHKGKTELELAARDVMTELRQTLGDLLAQVLAQEVKKTLNDENFLRDTLEDLVGQYVKSDLAGKATLEINLSRDVRKEMLQRLTDELRSRAGEGGGDVDVKAELADAGLEYQVSGPTVEITTDSVVEALSRMVSADMRKMLEQNTKSSPQSDKGDQSENE